ncbi:MAG: DUF58 domain-containing protein [Alphaproteobacteria bacterium]|nr:DUF58 domain-containing protein [Alphaproteobacteria bacterium]MDE2337222.1 DUF58 domain-containing protein [Alphaproteobacteria bacterium]
MSDLSKAGKIAGSLGVLLKAERVAHAVMKGMHGRRRTGTGEAFWQFRPWASGDARRDIDWRQTAKRDNVFIRQTEWEAAQTAWLWRDASASMDFGIKKEYAETLLLALGIVLLNGGEQAGLLGSGLAPQTGAPAIERLFAALPAQKELSENAHPAAAFSHVVLIGDFYFPLEKLRAFCAPLAARRVTGTLVQIFDPAEKDLPYKGRVRFEDIEGLDADAADIPQVEAIRADYAGKFAAHQEALAETAKRFGWRFEKFSTDTKPEAALTRLCDMLGTHA